MDVAYFLRKRTEFIRFFYDASASSFSEIRRRIEAEEPPYVPPTNYSEDPEPPFLEEWIDAATADQILGLACISLLSDALKQYFLTLRKRVAGFQFDDGGAASKLGLVPDYVEALGKILDTDWSDCPANLAIIEQVVLARNRGQHGMELMTFDVKHDGKTLGKYPAPFFATSAEIRDWPQEVDPLPWLFGPRLEVTRENLFQAIAEVEKLADYIDTRREYIFKWRENETAKAQTTKGEA